MVQKIGQITNADLYLNEVDVRGRVNEFDMGDLGHQEVEHSALGMIGVLKLPGRPVQAIEGKINFDWLDEEVERDMANPTKSHRAQLHSYVDIFDEDGLNPQRSHTLVTHLGFYVLKSGGRSAKLGEQMGSEYEITVHAFTQKLYGAEVPIIKIDIFNSIYEINGKQVWHT